ncbi:MAG: hypothetical protein V3T05_04935, partial [Myxococcota bacterium]
PGVGNVTAPLYPDEEGEKPGVFFDLDTSNDVDSAYSISPDDLTNGTVFEETIYPRYDDDFWKIPVVADGQIVDVFLQYGKAISPIELAADWIGPNRLCMASPVQACSGPMDCGGGVCDQDRGGCRSAAAAPCSADLHCGSGEMCAGAPTDLLGTAIESGAGTQHMIKTTLPAHAAGDYYLRVYDRANLEEDDETRYRLVVGIRPDRDVNEPNNAPNMATPLSNGVAVTGYFSYQGDVDYYRIDPQADAGATTPPVVNIDLRWPLGVTAEPTWTIVQDGKEYFTDRLPKTTGSGNLLGATNILPSTQAHTDRVENPSGTLDAELGYTLSVTIAEDPEEGAVRNDTPAHPVVVDASSFGTIHADQHTLVAENDIDWYRIDGATGVSDNSLFYMKLNASTDEYLLAVTFWKQIGGTCDPSTETLCGSGGRCACARSGGCGAGQGVCISQWVFRPVREDFSSGGGWVTWQAGGFSPNFIETQIPLFRSMGEIFVEVRHLTAAVPPRAGFGAAPYMLEMQRKQEPQARERQASESEFFPNPFNVSEGAFRNARVMEATGSSGVQLTGYISYEGDQDWYRIDTGISGETNVRIRLDIDTSPLDLRFDIRRGGASTGEGADNDWCRDKRNNCNNSPYHADIVNPDNRCYHFRAGSGTFYIHVNDAEFNDFDATPYSFTFTAEPGCTSACNQCRCETSRDLEECSFAW